MSDNQETALQPLKPQNLTENTQKETLIKE